MADDAKKTRKAQIDALLLQFPGVKTKKIGGLDGYFVGDRMFACINGEGIGLRVPAATARELQFSRDNVSAFQPAGLPASKEWIQVDRAEAADFEKDREIIQSSFDFVKGQAR